MRFAICGIARKRHFEWGKWHHNTAGFGGFPNSGFHGQRQNIKPITTTTTTIIIIISISLEQSYFEPVKTLLLNQEPQLVLNHYPCRGSNLGSFFSQVENFGLGNRVWYHPDIMGDILISFPCDGRQIPVLILMEDPDVGPARSQPVGNANSRPFLIVNKKSHWWFKKMYLIDSNCRFWITTVLIQQSTLTIIVDFAWPLFREKYPALLVEVSCVFANILSLRLSDSFHGCSLDDSAGAVARSTSPLDDMLRMTGSTSICRPQKLVAELLQLWFSET